MDEIEELIARLDKARGKIEALLPRVDPAKEIYPGWTIHHFLAHMTGWDEAFIASLRAHMGAGEYSIPAARGVGQFNAQTIETHETSDLEKVEQEWRQIRLILKKALRSMPEEKFRAEMVAPWGVRASVARLVEVFIHHEDKEHGPDLEKWLQNPDQPLEI